MTAPRTAIPYPLPPERPVPVPTHSPIPVVHEPIGGPYERLLAQRRVLIRGRLDSDVATRAAAELMALDADSTRDIELIVNSPGGPIADVLAVLDVVGLVRARVATTCFGQASGTAAAVVACGTGRRRATPNATLSLRCTEQEDALGVAEEVAAQAELARSLRTRLCEVVAAATRRSVDEIEHELSDGRPMDADAAVAAGLLDEVAR